MSYASYMYARMIDVAFGSVHVECFCLFFTSNATCNTKCTCIHCIDNVAKTQFQRYDMFAVIKVLVI